MKPISAIFTAILVTGCAPEDYRNYTPGDGETVRPGALLKVRVNSLVPSTEVTEPATSSSKAGHNSASQLFNLKYYVRRIVICQGLDVEGEAFTNHTGCLDVYQGDVRTDLEYDDPGQDLSEQADVVRENADGFSNLMDSAGRADLGRTTKLTPEAAGAYEWGFVSWYLPVMLKAEVPLAAGMALRTHDGDTLGYAAGNGYWYTTSSPGSFADGRQAEEAVVLHSRAGSWFRFQSPFVITADDIESGESFELDLTFDPEGMIAGYAQLTETLNLRDSLGNGMDIDTLEFVPTPHPEGEVVRVDSYRASIVGEGSALAVPIDRFDLRLDLYTIADDPTGTIHGATLTTLANEATATVVARAPKVALVHDEGNGALEFKDWSRTPILSGFVPQEDVGDDAEAWLSCSETGIHFSGCADHPESPNGQAVRFELESIRTLP